MKRGGGVVVLGALAAVLATGAAAPATGTEVSTGAGTEVGTWLLNEPGSPFPALDSSGFGNHGETYDVVGDGIGYVFNGTSSRVIVPDADSLDPGTADFSFGVTIVMDTPPALGETYDVLRKGLASTKGGNYKIEIKHVKGTARARCLVKDVNRVVAAIIAPTSLANGAPHTVTCRKTSKGVSIQIDALAPRTKTVTSLGSVSNASQFALGAKAETKVSSGFDWYQGRIDHAWVSVG